MKDYYAALEINPIASEEVIKAAYRALAKKYHTDSTNSDLHSEVRMREINEAYELLSDPVKKLTYDEECNYCNCSNIYGGSQIHASRQGTKNMSKGNCYVSNEEIYSKILYLFKYADSIGDYTELIMSLEKIKGYKDSDKLLEQCRKELSYLRGINHFREKTIINLRRARGYFERIPGWRDADSKLVECNRLLKLRIFLRDLIIAGSTVMAIATACICISLLVFII